MAQADEGFLKDLCRNDRTATLDAKQALISEYAANSLGYTDPEWQGSKPRGIQDLRFQSAMLANMAMWLIQPSIVGFTVAFHALTHVDSGKHVDPPRTMLCGESCSLGKEKAAASPLNFGPRRRRAVPHL